MTNETCKEEVLTASKAHKTSLDVIKKRVFVSIDLVCRSGKTKVKFTYSELGNLVDDVEVYLKSLGYKTHTNCDKKKLIVSW